MRERSLENYETVKSRKQKFYTKFPDGRIIVECIKADETCALFKAVLFKSKEDQSQNFPLSTGHAQEFKGQGGFANKHAWVENCEESAIGRALDNAGFASTNTCSQEEMKRVAAAERPKPVQRKAPPINYAPGAANDPPPFDQDEPVDSYIQGGGDPVKVLGDSICKVGKKFKGMRLRDIDPEGLHKYVKWLTDESDKQQKDLPADFKEFVDMAKAWLESGKWA